MLDRSHDDDDEREVRDELTKGMVMTAGEGEGEEEKKKEK